MCVVVMTMRLVIGMMIVRMAVIVSGRLMVLRLMVLCFVLVRLVVVMDGVGVMFAVVRLRFTGLHAFVLGQVVFAFV
jgi:hypothetical protein